MHKKYMLQCYTISDESVRMLLVNIQETAVPSSTVKNFEAVGAATWGS